MTDERDSQDKTTEDSGEQPARPPEGPSTGVQPPQQNADAHVRTDGGVDDPAAK